MFGRRRQEKIPFSPRVELTDDDRERLAPIAEQRAQGQDCRGRAGKCARKCLGRVLLWQATLTNTGVSLSEPQFMCGQERVQLMPDEHIAAYLKHQTDVARIHGFVIASGNPDKQANALPGISVAGTDYADEAVARLCLEFDGQPATLPLPSPKRT